MAKPYSDDLRERVVKAVEHEKQSRLRATRAPTSSTSPFAELDAHNSKNNHKLVAAIGVGRIFRCHQAHGEAEGLCHDRSKERSLQSGRW
jgi:hypothetical protein